ncbi:MAG TPA: hypothetical protein ENI53_00340 [Thermoplasmatales archaeon]|nr:hypothetical protein [Thermoplasmatales archaeon]
MNITKFVLILLLFYFISLIASFIIKRWTLFLSWVGIIALSFMIFSVIFGLFLVALAIAYAIIKEPVVEKGDYKIERIKGKGE